MIFSPKNYQKLANLVLKANSCHTDDSCRQSVDKGGIDKISTAIHTSILRHRSEHAQNVCETNVNYYATHC